MGQLLRRRRTVERPNGMREVTEARAEKPEQPASEATVSVKLIVGPPGCCCTSEIPVRKQPRRS